MTAGVPFVILRSAGLRQVISSGTRDGSRLWFCRSEEVFDVSIAAADVLFFMDVALRKPPGGRG